MSHKKEFHKATCADCGKDKLPVKSDPARQSTASNVTVNEDPREDIRLIG